MSAVADKSRAFRACLIVVALVLAVPVSGWGVKAVAGDAGDSAAGRQAIRSSVLLESGTPEGAIDRIEELLADSETSPSEAFENEIGVMEGAYDVRVSESGDVVGYLVEGTAPDVTDRLGREMERRGWTPVSLGSVDGATYVKQAGTINWALATCTQVDDSTSVVMRGEFA